MRRVLTWAIATIAPLAIALPLHAQDDLPPTEPVRIEFSADNECPSQEAFDAFVRARTTRIRHPRPGEASRTFQIVVTKTATGFRGVLRATDLKGNSSERGVSASSCRDTFEAVGLIFVLAVDPHANLSPLTSSSPAPSPSPSPSAVPSSSVSTSAEPVPDRGPEVRYGAFATVQAIGGMSPNFALALGGGLGVESSRTGAFSPLLRLSWVVSTHEEVTAGAYHLQFDWTGGQALVCSSKWAAGAFTFRPCLSGQLGLVSAKPTDTYLPQSSQDLQSGLGPTALFGIEGLGPLSVELFATAWFPLFQLHYYNYANGDLLYQTPAVAAWLGANIGLNVQ